MTEMRFWYPAAITQITSVNDSFDSCMLRVCYAGKNRNKTIISKETIEKAIPTMAYCPIVANYDVESDVIGGHDVGFIDSDNGLKMVNLTDAIGVVPGDPQWCWETVTEEDGTEREYLCTPAILWKRTPVYEKLKREGVSGQSMEINVNSGKMVDGLFEIDAFQFTAFCLLGEGVEPCFESAQVGMFALDRVGSRLSEMMDEFKRSFSKVIAASADDNTQTPQGEFILKGGEDSLERIEELLSKYDLTADDVTFETDGMSDEEIERKFSELHDAKFTEGGEEGEQGGEEPGDDQQGQENGGQNGGEDGGDDPEPEHEPEPEPEDDDDDAPAGTQRQFQLTGEQLRDGILNALESVTYSDEWGTWNRYGYVDYDLQANHVYALDFVDFNMYGFGYTMNGDNVVIDFDSKRRVKIAFVDFDMGDAQFSYKAMLDGVNARFAAVASEADNLRQFKAKIESEERKAQVGEVFARFADLAEDERFKALQENCGDMSVQDIEDKCYAIRGRNVQVKFALGNKPVRLPVAHGAKGDADEPYGGLFVEFGIGNR